MALTQQTTWSAGDILTASDLNGEFANIYTGGIAIISPVTATLDMNGKKLILDTSDDTSIHSDTDDQIDFEAGGTDVFVVDGTVTSPITGAKLIAGATGVEVTLQTMGEADTGLNFETSESEEMLELVPVATAVNNIKITSAIANANPVISSSGDTDNTGIEFEQKDGDTLMIIESVDAGVNEITISNAATGNNPTIACTGESDIGITLQNQDAEAMLVLDSVADTTNWLQISSAATGVAPAITQSGEDDVGFDLNAANSEEIIKLRATAAAVNEVTITNNASGSGPTITSSGDGTDANIDLNINTTGTGDVVITGGATGTVDLGNAAISWPNSDGAANTVLKTDGSAAAAFAALTYASGPATSSLLPLPRGHLTGLQMTRTDGDTITIAEGQCRNTGDDTNMILSASLAKDTTSAWTAGAGGGMIAAGEQNNTWYHVFIIENGSGTVDAGFDTSLTALNLLGDSSYTKYRRIGSIRTDGTPDILTFSQWGDYFLWDVYGADGNPTIGTSATTVTLDDGGTRWGVPSGVKVIAELNVLHDTDSMSMILSSMDVSDQDPSVSAEPLVNIRSNNTSRESGQMFYRTNTSGQVRFRSTNASNVIHYVTVGWMDRRGQDD